MICYQYSMVSCTIHTMHYAHKWAIWTNIFSLWRQQGWKTRDRPGRIEQWLAGVAVSCEEWRIWVQVEVEAREGLLWWVARVLGRRVVGVSRCVLVYLGVSWDVLRCVSWAS